MYLSHNNPYPVELWSDKLISIYRARNKTCEIGEE
jgi:hypothetical protein